MWVSHAVLGIEILRGNDNLITHCWIRNLGTEAVNIGWGSGNGGQRNGVTNCTIRDVGTLGMYLVGGDRNSLSPGNNYAINNQIYRYARWVRSENPAVYMDGVGNTVAHNLIHDAPHEAIVFVGNNHALEFNEVHDVLTETSDAGAFYIGRDFTQRGSVIRYNYFHDISGYDGRVNVVYLDDFASGTTVFGNVFYNVADGVLINGGRDNTVQNNVFVDCKTAVTINAIGLEAWAAPPGNDWPTLISELGAVNSQQPPYSVAYPQLVNILNDNPEIPKRNKVVQNIFFVANTSLTATWLDLEFNHSEAQTIEDNNQIENPLNQGNDPGFVSLPQENFQLFVNAPVYKLGFQRIPFEKIGFVENPDCRDVQDLQVRRPPKSKLDF